MSSLTNNPTALSVFKITEITAFAHCSTLLVYHLFGTLSKKQCVSKLQSLSVLAITIYLATNFLIILSSWRLHPNFMSCKTFVDVTAITYFLSKMTLYFLLFERLFTVFNNSAHSFSAQFQVIARLSLIIWSIITIVLIFWSGDGYYNPERDECYDNYPLWSIGITAGGDFVIGIYTSVMFCRRLMVVQLSSTVNESSKTGSTTYDSDYDVAHGQLKLSRAESSKSRISKSDIIAAMKSNRKLLEILKKFTFLTFLSVFTTLWSLAFIGLFELAGMWISIDGMVNSWSVLLMFGMSFLVFEYLL